MSLVFNKGRLMGFNPPRRNSLTLATGAQFNGSGAGITNLNAANVTSGTLPVARLNGGTTAQFVRGDGSYNNTLQGTAAGTDVPAARLSNTSASASSSVTLSLDPGNNGFGVRDALIRATNNGSNQVALSFLVANAAAPVTAFTVNSDTTCTAVSDVRASRFVGTAGLNAYLVVRDGVNTGLFIENTTGNLSGFVAGNRRWESSAGGVGTTFGAASGQRVADFTATGSAVSARFAGGTGGVFDINVSGVSSGYNGFIVCDNTALTIGHNSASRSFAVQTNSANRFTIDGNGAGVMNAPAAGTALSISGGANTALALTRTSDGVTFSSQRITGGVSDPFLQVSHVDSTATSILNFGSGAGSPRAELQVGGVGAITIGTNRSVTVSIAGGGSSFSINGSNTIPHLDLVSATGNSTLESHYINGVRKAIVGVAGGGGQLTTGSLTDDLVLRSTTAIRFSTNDGTSSIKLDAGAATQIVPGATSFALRNNGDTRNSVLYADSGVATWRSEVAGTATYSLKNQTTGFGRSTIFQIGVSGTDQGIELQSSTAGGSGNLLGAVTVFGHLGTTAAMGVTSSGLPYLNFASLQVVGQRIGGWTAATGTATRATFATGTVTTTQLAERVKALIDDLITHGLIGT